MMRYAMTVLVLIACGQLETRTLDRSALHPEIQQVYDGDGPECGEPIVCGTVVKIDCGSAVDGPLYYFDRSDGDLIQTCGGACFAPGPGATDCQECPPSEWACD